ncbi:Glycosyl transferase group 1 [Devosia sp. LC5]|uniref:glycosyltransferase n=1 Tax=Devosia sp. LC5 TaxID=1502724 RepID=UPI0004E40FF0|nr:glycosyltransferase [Devosia sp. LC5]KFC64904.1 Glycosyl transferase group 1 [Devosia sp. LC5]
MATGTIRNIGPMIMLVRALGGGGAQSDAIELANGLRAAGWPILIATLDSSGPLARHIAPGVPLLDLGQGRKLRMARAVPALLAMMRTLQPSAVIASEAAGNCLLAFAASRLDQAIRPKIVLREVAAPRAARRSDPYWQNRLAYRLARRLYPLADRVVSPGAAVRDELIAHFGVAPDRAVSLGTNAVLSAARLADLAAPVTRANDLILAIGRLSAEKDFATLIRAFAMVRQRLRMRLHILGEGSERPALERLIGKLALHDCVELPGFVHDPLPRLQNARLFVSSSRHEGFGNAIVEALACGTPVVATDAPYGPREILGRGHALVPPGNPPLLAEAILEAIERPVDRAALRSRAADFTTERTVEAFAAMLASMGLAPATIPTYETTI